MTNPYLNARKDWNTQYGRYVTNANAWRWTAWTCMGLSLLTSAGCLIQALQPKVVPYVVEVDKLGHIAAVQPATPLTTVSPAVIKTSLSQWIGYIRNVVADPMAERRAIETAYAFVNKRGSAYAFLNEHFQANNPFQQHTTTAVTVQSVLPLSGNTWRVEWDETVRDKTGQMLSVARWQATVTIQIVPPTDETTLQTNPLGIYVNALHWSKQPG